MCVCSVPPSEVCCTERERGRRRRFYLSHVFTVMRGTGERARALLQEESRSKCAVWMRVGWIEKENFHEVHSRSTEWKLNLTTWAFLKIRLLWTSTDKALRLVYAHHCKKKTFAFCFKILITITTGLTDTVLPSLFNWILRFYCSMKTKQTSQTIK